MKKVLLTTTAMAFAASMASAGDMSMSGAIKLTYGSFGTGSAPVVGGENFTSEADLDIAATSSGGNITMTGTLEIDEATETAAGPVTISTGALTFTYDANDLGALARTNAADGEDARDAATAATGAAAGAAAASAAAAGPTVWAAARGIPGSWVLRSICGAATAAAEIGG